MSEQAGDDRLYCRVAEAARLMSVPKRSLYQAIADGRVPGARTVGGARIVPLAWVRGEASDGKAA